MKSNPIDPSKKGWIQLDLKALINADAGAFAILVSYGAVLGLLSPIQVSVPVCMYDRFVITHQVV